MDLTLHQTILYHCIRLIVDAHGSVGASIATTL